MADILTTSIDPVEGLVNYTNFVKPYHTKVLEVLVEYIHTDCIDVTFSEDFHLSLGAPETSLLSLWGWTEEEAAAIFNCNYHKFQLSGVDSGTGYWEVVGDASSEIEVGEVILVQTTQLQHAPFTVINVVVDTSSSTVNDPYYGYKEGSPLSPGTDINITNTRTKIYVSEAISPGYTSSGAVIPESCYSKSAKDDIYVQRAGIVFPSPAHVDQNINCGGFGAIFQQAISGSPPTLGGGFDVPNSVLDVSTSPMYFEIANNVGVPASISSWESAYKYGVKFGVSGSTGNDNDSYTVLFSLIAGGSPERLRIYVLENIPSAVVDGDIQLRPWGYDEPAVCVDDGQGLTARSSISENMQLTINDVGANILQGWDMAAFDIAGFDGGSFTYWVAFT